MTLLAHVRPVAEHIKAGVRTYVRTPRSVGDIRQGGAVLRAGCGMKPCVRVCSPHIANRGSCMPD